jgi:hypothetical protein
MEFAFAAYRTNPDDTLLGEDAWRRSERRSEPQEDREPMSISLRRITQAVLASVVTTAAVLAGAGSPATAAPVALNLSKTFGTSGAGGTLIAWVTPSTAVTPFPANRTPVVQYQFTNANTTGCSTTVKTLVQAAGTLTTTTAGVLASDPVTVKRVTSWKIVFQVPSAAHPDNPAINTGGLALVGSQTQAKWNICVYDVASPTSSTLIGTATYTIAAKPTITSITPASSPAAGGQLITVNGTGFTPVSTPTSGSIGGVPLTNVKVAANGNSFTATTGARTPDTGLFLSVVAPGGTVVSSDPDNDPVTVTQLTFTYTNGVTVSPNTGVAGKPITLSVTGAGFSGLTFDIAQPPTSTGAHVFLVEKAYDPAGNRGVAECLVAAVVSDTELVCDLDLTADQLSPTTSAPLPGTPITDGAYIVTVVANGSTSAGSAAKPSIISSGSAFVVAPY